MNAQYVDGPLGPCRPAGTPVEQTSDPRVFHFMGQSIARNLHRVGRLFYQVRTSLENQHCLLPYHFYCDKTCIT